MVQLKQFQDFQLLLKDVFIPYTIKFIKTLHSYETLKIHSAILSYLFIDRLLYISVLVYFITTKATKYLKISYQKITY